MKSYADKNQKKSNRVADSFSNPQQSAGAAFQFVDNRTAAVAQRQLAEAINTSPRQVAQRQEFNTLFGNAAQLQSMDEDELQMKTDSAVLQRTGPEEEELLQGKFETVQRQEGLEEEELLQGKFDAPPVQRERDSKPNHTGLPDNIKAGIENLSGYSMDDVNVHYNSPKPAQIQAHAYAQGTDIHLASGQAKHLPHEAWHVVQQKQGRVKPTIQMKTGTPVNDDQQLEREADVMGKRAMTIGSGPASTEPGATFQTKQPSSAVVQLGRGYPGDNPKGRGGKGGYSTNKGGKAYVHKSGKAEYEMLRRQAIGSHHAKSTSGSIPRARGPVAAARRPAPGHAVPGHAVPPQDLAPDRQDPVPIIVPAPVPAPRRDGEDLPRPAHDVIDIGEDEPERRAERGMGERIRDKTFGGRTFGDTSNLIGATANLVEDVVPASTLLVIGSSGVMVSGIKLFVDGLTRRDEARTNEERRESIYTIVMGLANITSGVAGIESAIFALLERKDLAALFGIVSTGAWATTELTNIVSQIDIIRANLSEGEARRAYIKPIAAILASLLKCIGGVIYVYASIVSSSESSDEEGLVNIGVVMMMVGAAMSTLHGIIKLLGMCMRQCRESQEDDELPVIGNEMV